MLKELREEYRRGRMTAKEYDSRIFELHGLLLEYGSFIEDGPCESIQVTKEGTLCHFLCGGRSVAMYLDGGDYCAVPAQLLNYGSYEKEETEVVCRMAELLDDHSVIFDVGSNLGWYGLNMKKVNPLFSVYMFEPVPDTYERLVRNLSANHMDAAYCFNLGFHKENQQVDFYYDVKASGASSMADLRQEGSTRLIKARMRTMDDFVKEQQISRLDFIKCDVEGSELFVYQGGQKTIEAYKPVIFSEMLRKWSAKFGYHPNDILKLFWNMGYKCFVIGEKDRLRPFDEVTEDTVETNYFFLHEEKHRDLIRVMAGSP